MLKHSILMYFLLFIFTKNSVEGLGYMRSPQSDCDDDDDGPSGHIIGGKEAYLGQFNYQVSIRTHEKKRHHCGGSIISKHFILSAAHCFHKRKKDPKLYYIVLGVVSIKKVGAVYALAKFKMHERYSKIEKVNDICLIKTKRPIQFNHVIAPIKICREQIPAGKIVTVSGWGMTDYDNRQFPALLQYIKAKTISYSKCKMYVSNVNPYMHLCTMKLPHTGFCKGDSGGPLEYNGLLVGIVSFAITCAANNPDVYVRVSHYEKWIMATVKQLKYKTDADIPVFV